MSVQHSTCRSQNTAGRTRKQKLRALQFPLLDRTREGEGRISPINQVTRVFGPFALERNETRVVFIGSAKIEFRRAICLRVFDRAPKQKRHYPQMLELFVIASVFVNNGVLKA